MATFSCPLVRPEDSFWSHVRFKPTKVCNKALKNLYYSTIFACQAHVEKKPHPPILIASPVLCSPFVVGRCTDQDEIVANSEFRVKSAPNPPLAKITGPSSLKLAPPFSRTQMCDRALHSTSSSMKTSARGDSRIGCGRLVPYVMCSDADHSRNIKKAARWARSHSFWSNGRFKPTEKKQHGAQQHVLLVEVCLETHPCPAQAHVKYPFPLRSSGGLRVSPPVSPHLHSDTVSTGSVSVNAPGMFYVPQGVAPPAQAPLRSGAVLRRFPRTHTRV